MTNKQSIIVLIVLVLIVIAIVGVVLRKTTYKAEVPKEVTEGPEGVEGVEGEVTPTPTREEAPEDIVVPEIGSEVEEGVAVPKLVTRAAPGVEAKLRRFDVKAENEAYSPSTIIVNGGDSVRIDFTAVDKKYDFVLPDYGMYQVAEAGQTKVIGFQASASGKFLFYSDIYGGPGGKMKGYLIVK